MSKTSTSRTSQRARVRALCFSLLALTVTAPRGCCMAPASASADDDSQPRTVVEVPVAPGPTAPEAPAADAPPASLAAAEPADVARLRAMRAHEAKLLRDAQLVRAEARELAREDRDLYPTTGPLVSMGVGFGLSAAALAFGTLVSIGHGSSSDNGSRETMQRTLLAMHAVGIPTGLVSVGVLTYRTHKRPNRERIRDLEYEQRDIKRELRDLRSRERDTWSLLPELSLQDARAGLSVRHVF